MEVIGGTGIEDEAKSIAVEVRTILKDSNAAVDNDKVICLL